MEAMIKWNADVWQHQVESIRERSEEKGEFLPNTVDYLNQYEFHYLPNFAKWKIDFNITPLTPANVACKENMC